MQHMHCKTFSGPFSKLNATVVIHTTATEGTVCGAPADFTLAAFKRSAWRIVWSAFVLVVACKLNAALETVLIYQRYIDPETAAYVCEQHFIRSVKRNWNAVWRSRVDVLIELSCLLLISLWLALLTSLPRSVQVSVPTYTVEQARWP